jgi:hypothetical protein
MDDVTFMREVREVQEFGRRVRDVAAKAQAYMNDKPDSKTDDRCNAIVSEIKALKGLIEMAPPKLRMMFNIDDVKTLWQLWRDVMFNTFTKSNPEYVATQTQNFSRKVAETTGMVFNFMGRDSSNRTEENGTNITIAVRELMKTIETVPRWLLAREDVVTVMKMGVDADANVFSKCCCKTPSPTTSRGLKRGLESPSPTTSTRTKRRLM